jgi:uncharacterized protein DUF6489
LPWNGLVDHIRRVQALPFPRRLRRNAHRGDTAGGADRLGADMKVNIEIDCTPIEARQFMGLPDVVPMQTAMMDKMQQQLMSNIEKVSPESLIQSWFSFDPKLAERFQEMFVAMAGLGSPKKDKK